jgi:hypothetical protein
MNSTSMGGPDGLGGQGTARYKLRRGSTDSGDGVGEQGVRERERGSSGRKRARVGRSKGSTDFIGRGRWGERGMAGGFKTPLMAFINGERE